jgi:tyrosinase
MGSSFLGTGKIPLPISPQYEVETQSRYTIWAYENALRDECGFAGTQPYWDWSLDTSEHNSSLNNSPLWDPVHGFGGNGANGSIPFGISLDDPNMPPVGSCIADGPFVNFTNPLGWGYNLNTSNPHCLKRNFQNDMADIALSWRPNVLPLLRLTTYASFVLGMGQDIGGTGALAGVHGCGHLAVGGEVC